MTHINSYDTLSPYLIIIHMISGRHTTSALFRYSGNQKHIKIIEKQPENPSTILMSLLLDEQLSVVHRQANKDIMIDKRQNKKQIGPESGESSEQPIIFQIETAEEQFWFEKWYLHHHKLTDFVIGREHWGRHQNSLKIESDLISREHTAIVYKGNNSDQAAYLQSLQTAISTNTRRSSEWRKVTNQLLQLIVSFVLGKPSYAIQDRESRNGTYLIDYSKDKIAVRVEEAYQFQAEKYLIQFEHVATVRGKDASQLLTDFQTLFASLNSRYTNYLSIILPNHLTRQSLALSQLCFNVLQLEFDVNYELKYYYWVVNQEVGSRYSIGEGQLLGMNYAGGSNVSRHGVLAFEEGEWRLWSEKETQRVWVRLQPKREYVLSQRGYKVMIAHHTVLQLQFHNFS